MNKIMISVLAIAMLFSVSVFSQELEKGKPRSSNQTVSEKKDAVDWDFLQIMFFPGFPTYPDDSVVCGVKIGLPVSGGKGEVFGLEVAGASCMTNGINGVQMAPFFNLADEMKGAQFSTVNVAEELCDGAQFGLVNYSAKNGIQFGLVNYMENGFLKFFPIVNFSTQD